MPIKITKTDKHDKDRIKIDLFHLRVDKELKYQQIKYGSKM